MFYNFKDLKIKILYLLEFVLKFIFLFDSKVFIKIKCCILWFEKKIYDDFDEYGLLVFVLYKSSVYIMFWLNVCVFYLVFMLNI